MRTLSKLKILGLFVTILYFTIIFLSIKFAGLSVLDSTKDNPLINNGESIFYGLISNIGIFLWILSFSLSLFLYVSKKKIINNNFLLGVIN